MPDLKITQLSENTTPIGTDVMPMVDDPAGTPVTKKVTLTNLGIVDGWIPSGDSWAYASTSTITVPSGAASLYQKGDRIKFTQTTVKYFVIVAVADTVLTLFGGTDYTVANAAISAISYSHKENPLGYPDWFACAAPTYTVSNIDDGAGGQPTTNKCRARVSGKTAFVSLQGNGTKATTNNFFDFQMTTFPPILTSSYNSRHCIGGAHLNINSVESSVNVFFFGGDSHIYIVRDANMTDNHTIADFSINVNYEI